MTILMGYEQMPPETTRDVFRPTWRDRHALVISAARPGIGRATAPPLLTAVRRRGNRAWGAGGRPLQDAVSAGHAAFATTADVTDETACAQAVAAATEALGPIAILVNAAGAAETAPFQKATAAMFERMWRINVLGAVNATHAALPSMVSAGFGRVVNIASTASLKGYRYVSAYVAAKHALLGFTREGAGAGNRRQRRDRQCGQPRFHRHRPDRRQHRQNRRAHRPLPRPGNPRHLRLTRSQPAGPPDPPGRSRRRGPVSVPAGRGSGKRTGVGGGWGRDMTPDDGPAAIDLETALAGTPAGDKEDLRLWLRMLSSANLIEAEIRRRLREQSRHHACRGSTLMAPCSTACRTA